MRIIFFVNNNQHEDKQAAEVTIEIAKRGKADIILANNYIKVQKYTSKIPAGSVEESLVEAPPSLDVPKYIESLNGASAKFRPSIKEIDISGMDENNLAKVINESHAWMIVKGMPNNLPYHHIPRRQINIQAVLNKVLCPLFLIPSCWQIKSIDRIAYLVDLRYCRIHILKYVTNLAGCFNASVSIEHLSAKGLPDIASDYAVSIFQDEIRPKVKYGQLYFNNIKEKDILKALDVIVNGMRTDVLAMINHRFHFEKIVGRCISNVFPHQVSVPLLIFPS